MNFTNISKQAATYRQSPGPGAWSKLDQKLSQQEFKSFSIAPAQILKYASVMIGLSGFLLLFLFTRPTNLPTFESEVSEVNIPEIYSIEKMASLNSAYVKTLGEKQSQKTGM